MCSDLYKPLKNNQLNLIANYYKFDLENSVNKSLFFKNFSRGAITAPLPHLPPFGAMCLRETYGFIKVPTHH